VHGVGIVPAILTAMAAGAAIGVFSGSLAAYGKLPPFIVTLGMLGIGRGAVLVLTDAPGYELNAIAACVIGGASLFGAKGGAFGAAAGALIVGVLNNGGSPLAIDSFSLQISIGALILAAVRPTSGRGAGREAPEQGVLRP
jgi:ribose/xylose/arabinose/galactoside ABC-type transport system permease subunit